MWTTTSILNVNRIVFVCLSEWFLQCIQGSKANARQSC
jgi:hypothetical protein